MNTLPALSSLALAAVVALLGCSAAPGDETFDDSSDALTTPPTVTLKRGLFSGEVELECHLTYGPIIKIKPKGGLTEEGTEAPQAGPVYGPVITIKPKGFSGEGYDCPINDAGVLLQRDFGGAKTEPGLECSLTYGPVIAIEPTGTTETYGPVIKVKPQGFDDGIDCAAKWPNLVLKRGAAEEAPEAAIECSEPGPLLSLTPPVR